MRPLSTLTLALFGAALCFAAPDEAAARGKKKRGYRTITHKVRKGETFEKIAKRYRVTTRQLRRWNRKANPRKLQIGQKIRVAVPRRRSSKRAPSKPSPDAPAVTLGTLGIDAPSGGLPAAPPAPEPEPLRGPSLRAERAPHPIVSTKRELDEIKAGRASYVVQRGESVGSIALRLRLDPADLMRWNELDALILRPGRVLTIRRDEKPPVPKDPQPVVHRVRRGDTFERIAKKYRVSVRQLRRWNRRVNPRRLQIGQKVRLRVRARDGTSQSWGAANRGRLYNGVPLTEFEGLKIRKAEYAYGTRRVVRLIRAAAADVRARWPDTPALVVADLSYRAGGRMKRHKSHQSGRDADIVYYHRGGVRLRDMHAMDETSFDAAKNWHLLKTLIDTGQVEYVFVNYPLQRRLYAYARSIGYTDEELAPILQYPRPRGQSTGLIRHARGHLDHFHIRFTCGPLDRNCR